MHADTFRGTRAGAEPPGLARVVVEAEAILGAADAEAAGGFLDESDGRLNGATYDGRPAEVLESRIVVSVGEARLFHRAVILLRRPRLELEADVGGQARRFLQKPIVDCLEGFVEDQQVLRVPRVRGVLERRLAVAAGHQR